MLETSPNTPGITSPQDRIAILEDLVAFHADRNVRGASHLLRIAADLNSAARLDLPAEAMREAIACAFKRLTRLGHELAFDSLDSPGTLAALKRWPYIADHPEMLS